MRTSRVHSFVAVLVSGCLCLLAVLATPAISGAANESSTTTVPSEPSTNLNRSASGADVTEITGFGNQVMQVAAGVPLVVGVGPAVGSAVGVSSFEEFTTRVPSSSSYLHKVVQQFFANGGKQAFISGSADASAAAIIAAFSSPIPGAVDLLVSADLNELPASEWIGVAVAMGRAAERSHAIALIDVPQSVISAAKESPTGFDSLTALGTDLRTASGPAAKSMFVFASGGVTSEGALLPMAPFMAGLFAANAQNKGVWTVPTGFGNTIAGVKPQFATSLSQGAALQTSGLVPLSYMPGRGTVVASDRLLSSPDDAVQNTATLNSIEAHLQQMMQQYVFSPNDAATWAAVCAAFSTYLTQLWQQGILLGPTAADAFTANCQALSAQQILNGFLSVQVGVAVQAPGQFVTFTLTQQQAASG